MKIDFLKISAIIVMFLPVAGKSQSLEQMQQLFPGKLAVFSNIKKSVDISFKNGTPYAEANEVSEMMILNDNANGFYNKDKIYHSDFNELEKVEAYTLVPDGNSTQKIKVTDFKTQSSPGQDIFYDDMKETSFDYPQMLKGSIAHVEATYLNKDIRFLTGFYFTNYLPVHNASYTVTFPEDMDVRYIIKNDNNKIVTVKETSKGRKKRLEFTANDVKNFEYFSDGTSFPYYAIHVIIYVASYHFKGESIPVFDSINDLYKWDAGFLTNINSAPDENLKKITDSICINKKTDKEKAMAIYMWVQNHIKYVAFESGLEGFVPRQAGDVCAKRYGDCKDMASILSSMLTMSGLDAHFTWVGTRSIPYSYTEVPLPIVDNHMICAVKIDNSWIFLDATDPNCIFGMPSSFIQNKEALISLGPEKYEIVKVPIVPADNNVIIDSTFLSINNHILIGHSSVDYTGYFGVDVYNNLLYNKGDDERVYARKRMAKGSNKFIMKAYTIDRKDSVKKIANISADFEIPDYAKTIAGEIFINLNLEKLFDNVPIDTSKRKIAIENDYLYTLNQVHTLKIPEGYTVGYVPANFSISNDLIDFSIKYNQSPGVISATQKLLLKKLYIEPDEFILYNNTIRSVAPAYKEQVVLKKN